MPDTHALRELLDYLAEAPLSAAPEAFPGELVERIAAVLPAELIVWNEFDLGASSSFGVSQPSGVLVGDPQAAFERNMTEHPLIRHYTATGDHRAIRLSDVTSMRAFRRLTLYDEFFSPLRISHQLTCGTSPAPRVLVGLALNRAHRDFSDADVLSSNCCAPTSSRPTSGSGERRGCER